MAAAPRRGHEVAFATERGGSAPSCDPRLLDGVIFGQLGADPEPIAFYARARADAGVPRPARVGGYRPRGLRRAAPARRPRAGHAPVPRKRPAAGAGGGVLGARAPRRGDLPRRARPRAGRDPATGRSVLAGRRTTCLPKSMERSAFFVYRVAARPLLPHLPRLRRRTRSSLRSTTPRDFDRGPPRRPPRHGRRRRARPSWSRTAHYVSARWPGDAYLFARRFIDRLQPRAAGRATSGRRRSRAAPSGAWAQAASAAASTSRVSRGSMTPSSQSRAVE